MTDPRRGSAKPPSTGRGRSPAKDHPGDRAEHSRRGSAEPHPTAGREGRAEDRPEDRVERPEDRVERAEEAWHARLTPLQFHVTREGGTEPPFSGRYARCETEGVYRCVCCGAALFDSEHKYDSGSGWPSFWRPVRPDAVRTRPDTSHGMRRIEALCRRCDAHLGHVFPDGPDPTGERWCINSVSLELDEKG